MNINYKSYQDEIVALRRHFHMYPETAFNEIKQNLLKIILKKQDTALKP